MASAWVNLVNTPAEGRQTWKACVRHTSKATGQEVLVWGWGAVGRRKAQLHRYGGLFGVTECAGTSVAVMLHNIARVLTPARSHFKMVTWERSLTVQRLGLHTVSAKGVGSVAVWGTKILQGTRPKPNKTEV